MKNNVIIMYKFLFILCVVSTIPCFVFGGLHRCCPHTRSRECKENCKKLVAPSIHDYKDYFTFSYLNRRLTGIVEKCPRSESLFWDCLHSTALWKDFRLAKVKVKKRSKHSVCCKRAKHISCEVECFTTNNISQLLQNENCNAVREPKLSKCVLNAKAGKKCCPSKDKICKKACMKYFKIERSDSVLPFKQELEQKCGKNSRQFKCAINETHFDTAIQDFAVCCEKGVNNICVNSCKKTLQSTIDDFQKLFDNLAKPCGRFKMSTPIYKCFIERMSARGKTDKAVNQKVIPVQRTGTIITYPSFKEQCCNRAKSNECRRWCRGTISSPNLMGLWDTMYLSCIQNPKEVELSNCMCDILEPCEIGVKEKMSFCSNFNDKSLELFRRGDHYGDSAARKLHKFWSDGLVPVLEYSLVFKNVHQCKPEMFKAMACLLAVKPCDHRSSQTQVCRSDCEELLDACLDKEQSGKHFTVKRICAAILPNQNQTNCISVKDYTNKSPSFGQKDEVTLPCESNPCEEDEVCMINQHCSGEKNSVVPCQRHTCVKGCAVSGKSKLIIPVGQLAKLSTDDSDKDCFQVCKCQFVNKQQDAMFSQCTEFGCNKRSNCTVSRKTYYDGEIFENDCNTCTCTDGGLVCTEKRCVNSHTNGRPRRHHSTTAVSTNSPCNCHNVFKPVCGLNGMTFPNSCLAKCCNINDNQLNVGDCQSIDPCSPDPCTHGLHCVPRRSVCLSPWRHCPQYTCLTSRPRHVELYPLCEKNEGKVFGKVCGFDGVTYKNKCVAEDSGTGVDYEGSCLPHKFKNAEGNFDRCSVIKCPTIDNTDCNLTVPPGACCPVCGSMIRSLYSKKDLIRHQNFISYDPITVADIVKHMRQLLKVAECKLHGHLTVENDLLLIIVVDTHKPTRGQVHACKIEAERFNKYINNKSPMVTTSYYLSLLKASKLKSASWKNTKSSSTAKYHRTISCTLVLLCTILSTIYINFIR